MALSQVQCLDDNHVNPRTHESKPEFFYCEEQRLALEALLRDGREAFAKHLDARGRRGFLSDPELDALLGAVEPYDPDSELLPSKAEDDETPVSLHYWPDLSDTSVPRLDLGWPDSDSYRGVTRATVYAQPPLDGQAHIKEVVRKMIAQAQKVIAVVMDVFTDVDIFRDLLDAGFKRRVSVYVLLDRTTLPHFTSMCRRANMHAGHLKHLRVRCTDGAEFYTRSCTKVKGRMGHRFMFVDGDKAVAGSYSFTWMSSRLDRNLITVVTGQAVEAFDRLFRHLWSTSRSVDLRQVATEPEPEPEPLPQPAAVLPPSAAIARKLYNPKYALVALGNPSQTPSADSKDPQNLGIPKNPDVQETSKDKKKRASKEAIEDVAPLHPGLIDLEKACLISYLPTWPEPDPPSDVIGFINIRDSSKPTQVHLQRSEMFETSQAIRFSSPLSTPREALPEVAKPRQLGAKRNEVANQTNAVDRSEPARRPSRPDDVQCKKEARKQEAPSSGRASELDTHTPHTPPLDAHTPPLDTHTPHAPPLDTHTPHAPPLDTHTPPQSSSNGSSSSTQTVTTNSSKSESLPPNEAETTSATPESNISQSPHPHEANAERCAEEGTNTQQQDMTPSTHSHVSTSSQSINSTSVCENAHIPNTSTDARLSAATTSSPLCRPPPIPKPRTIHLVIQGAGVNENLPNISVDWTESLAGTGQAVQTQPEKEAETVPEVHLSETGAQEDAENTASPDEAPQQKQSVTPRETEAKQEAAAAETQTSAVQESSPSTDGKITSRTQTHDTKSSEKRPSSCDRNTPRGAGGHEPPSTSTRETNPPGDGSTGRGRDPGAAPAPPAHINAASGESPPAFAPRGCSHTPERPLRPRLSDTHVPDLRSPTSERQLLPDGLPPDSRTHTPDPRPDLRSPTSDVSDGYVSPRDDSTVSTASDEYYECSEAPVHDPILDPGCRKNGSTEDHVTPNATTTTPTCVSPADVNHNSHPADSSPPHSETRVITRKEENVAKRRSNKEAKKTGRDPADKGSQAPRRKRPVNKSTGEILVDGGNSTDPKRLSTAGLKPDNGERSDTETLEPGGGMEKGGGPQSTRDPDGQKFPCGQQQQQQQDSGSSSPTRPPPPNSATQPLGSRPWGSHQLNQTRCNHLHTTPPSRLAVSHSQQQQPGVGQRRHHHPKHQSPVPLHSAIHPQPPPHSQSPSVSEHDEVRAPFTITFGRLYSLKGLRDRMNKLPAPSKRGSTS